MGNLIVTEFITLDGVVEAPGGEPGHPHTGWVSDYFDDEVAQYKLDETLAAESHLLGRVTYDSFAGAWPDRTGPMADKINAMPKHVVSGTLSAPLPWHNSHLIADDVAGSVGRLKETTGGSILVVGSATLVRHLLATELVDELRLLMMPVTIGGGLRLFDDDRAKRLFSPTHVKSFDTGALAVHYRLR
ncbi:dihydrofolate reductase family protein [Gordonia zhaorongruii]|uniref:dihydrofolate reductase family protein n=1 Tax=Gordonia zhaorongruii TaxID=2597659 RepID=UPI00104F7000|nr:dihydrofolate reductase family protein [Gordonia zhaorongruii]